MVLRMAKPCMYTQKTLCHTYTTVETLGACPVDLAPEPLCLSGTSMGPSLRTSLWHCYSKSGKSGSFGLLGPFKMLYLNVAQQDAWILKSLILLLQKSLADGLRWL